jgi:DNA replication licensing factor MCM4
LKSHIIVHIVKRLTVWRSSIIGKQACVSLDVYLAHALIVSSSLFSDKQCVRIQETPDETPEGETPCHLMAFAYDDLVDMVRPGDRIEVTGIFR